MNVKKAVLLGCGGVALLAIAAVIATVLLVAHIAKDPEGMAVTVNGPADVVVGQTFDLEILVKNQRAGKVLNLSDVDVAEEYLAGFTVTTVKPAPKSNAHVPLDNKRSYTFGVPISAGTTQSFVFTLRAEKAGIYRGDVDACEGMQFITGMAQTVVKEKP